MQVVNWGTFCGYHRLEFSQEGERNDSPVIMMTGESGTGKSTLFDAKTAVMMRHTARFNSASNATGCRVRGAQERNIWSYVLGKLDDTIDSETGEVREHYLRDTSTANWSGIALTYRNDVGARFCAARLYYVRAHAAQGELETSYLTAEDELNLRLLERRASEPFKRATLQEVFPRAIVHDGVTRFLNATWQALSIGDDPEAAGNAMDLHQKIQSGYSIRDVDSLFKDLVIDDPTTFAEAQRAVESFDENEAAWQKMDRSRRKMADLEGIRETHENCEQRRQEEQLLASLGGDGAESPLALWEAETRAGVLNQWAGEVAEQAGALEDEVARLTANRDRAKREYENLRLQVQKSGGDVVDELRRDVATLEGEFDRRKSERDKLAETLRRAGTGTPETKEEYERLESDARKFLEGYEIEREDLQQRRTQLQMELYRLREEKEEHERDLAYWRAHPANITRSMADARDHIADAMGMKPDELPYAAELMDMAEGEEEWRVAANVGLHGLATLMLVDKARLKELRACVNGLKLTYRVNFRGVDPGVVCNTEGRDGFLSSKVVFKEDMPFAGWVKQRVMDARHDIRCVDGPQDLGGDELAITREGQTAQGERGAHGFNPKTWIIIGFSNARRIEELCRELEDLQQKEAELIHSDHELADASTRLGLRRDAARDIRGTSWETIDTAGCAQHLTNIRERLREAEGNQNLRQLIGRRDEAEHQVDVLNQNLGAAKGRQEQMMILLSNTREAAQGHAESAKSLRETGVGLTEAQQAKLAELWNDRAGTLAEQDTHDALAKSLDGIVKQVTDDVRQQLAAARNYETRYDNELCGIFRRFKDNWPDETESLGTEYESYPDYLSILEGLEADKLAQPTDEWLKNLFRLTAAALVPLASAFSSDPRTMRARMQPINDIMSSFRFGSEGGHLSVSMRDQHPADVADYRRSLQEWTALATRMDEDQITERQHRRLREFIDRTREEIRKDRSSALNTKRLTRITVQVTYPKESGQPDKVFSTLGAKSGGESQELIAFILGAALLFCLGNNYENRPTFSPVFLDEAFIKADERYTQRSITALAGLGFQVIIAVPTSKVQAVEPIADEYIIVTKSRKSHSFVKAMNRGEVAGAVND